MIMAKPANEPVSLTDLITKLFQTRFEDDDCTDLLSAPAVSPMLVPGVTNNIVVYHGAFNPPHRGHLETLYLGRSPFFFNATAAFVIPNSDERVRQKGDSKGFDMVVPSHVRHDIWAEATRNDGWTYVCKHSEAKLADVLLTLAREAATVGIEVKMYSLSGSDHFRGGTGKPAAIYEYNAGLIYTDWSREELTPGSFEDGAPGKMPFHDEWVQVSALALQDAGLRDIRISEPEPGLPKVWMAKSHLGEHVSFFVQRPPGGSVSVPRDISSTKIRKAIKGWTSAPYDTRGKIEALSSSVISPEVLVGWLNSRKT